MYVACVGSKEQLLQGGLLDCIYRDVCCWFAAAPAAGKMYKSEQLDMQSEANVHA